MVTVMTSRIKTLDDVKGFLSGTESVDFRIPDRKSRLAWLSKTLSRLEYHRLGKKDKGWIRQYVRRITGFSRAQLSRQIREHRRKGRLEYQRRFPAKPFQTQYTAEDARLLAEMDALHETLSGPATKVLCQRAFHRFGDSRFERLAQISVSHLYNLRKSTPYQRKRGHIHKTRAVRNSIGERCPPQSNGMPGFLRVDTVHSGDWDGEKGLYYINAVDQELQFEAVLSVEYISEAYLKPILENLLRMFPFILRGFHADNGSEFINHYVAQMLNKLLIRLTKSRPRHSNDNALVESKNGAVVRKHLGYAHIPVRYCHRMNQFLIQNLFPYLNFHRPCFFPVTHLDDKGRIRRTYPLTAMMTPYERLKALPKASQYLRPGLTFDQLDDVAYAISDNEAARQLARAKEKLFSHIFGQSKRA
jgi:hypothetical protein